MLNRKLVRDIKKNIISTITIVFITALGIMFWSGFEGITINLNRIINGYYSEYEMPDIFVSGEHLTYADIKDLLKQDGVIGASGRTVVDFNVEDVAEDSELRVYFQDFPMLLNRSFIVEGSSIKSGDGRRIMLDYDYLLANNLNVGDEIKLRLNNDYYTYTIAASIKSPENMYLVKDSADLYPSHSNFGFAFLDSIAGRDMIYNGQKNIYNQLVIKVQDGYLEEIKNYITYKLGTRAISITDRTGQFSASMVEQESSSIESMVGVFPTVFFMIAALIAYSSIKRMVDKERTAIGTMKALGIKNAAIIFHYTGYGLIYGILASIIGVSLGIYLPIGMMRLFERYFSFPPYTVELDFYTSMAASISAVSMCTLAAFMAGRKTLKLSPSVCMRPKSSKPGKKILFERIGFIWKRLGFIIRVVLRNMFRSKDRLVMCVFGISCSCALVFIAFGFQTTIDNLIEGAYDNLNSYDVQVYFKEDATDIHRKRVLRIPEVEYGELIMETSAKVAGSGGTQKTTALTITPDVIHLLGIYDERDTSVPLPDKGCIISDHLAGELGVAEGDYITLYFTGKSKTIDLKINNVITLSFGQGIYISQSAWRRAGEGFSATSGLLKIGQDREFSGVKEVLDGYEFLLGSKFQSELKADMVTNMEVSKMSVYIMILFAGLISFIVLFNLGIINFYEREREIATLKVLGFYSREVRKMAFGENYIFSVIGILMGCFLGNSGLDLMLKMSASEFYTFEKSISYVNFAYTAAAMFLFAVITNLFLARYVKRIDIIGALKAKE